MSKRTTEIRKLIQDVEDVFDGASLLIENGYAVSRAEGKRIFMQCKEYEKKPSERVGVLLENDSRRSI